MEAKVPASPLPIRAWQWDLARQPERLDWLADQIRRHADWGYTQLYLHLEDSVEYPSLPGVARPGAYTRRQLGLLVETAERAGVKVVPIANLLGHTQYLIKVPEFRDLNELRASDGSPLDKGQVCPLHPRLPEIAGKLFKDLSPFCTAGRIHVGLDESYNLGRHPLSRQEIARDGLEAHFARYVHRLKSIASEHNLSLGIWADMLALLPGIFDALPSGITIYDWYYYPFSRLPAVELQNFRQVDLARPASRKGIEYWGAPMSGAFRYEPVPIVRERIENILSWWRRCLKVNASGILVTSWEAQRLAAEIPAMIEAAAAGIWLEGETDPARLIERGCVRAFGKAGNVSAEVLLLSDRYPFSGYYRWRVLEDWNRVPVDQPAETDPSEGEELKRLVQRAKGVQPVSQSIKFRRFISDRDRFVQGAAEGIWSMRWSLLQGNRSGFRNNLSLIQKSAQRFGDEIEAGAAAARGMWRRTRKASPCGPNEAQVRLDARTLRRLKAWLGQCRRRPELVWGDSPVVGRWQLLFTVINRRPAAQKVVVEQMGRDGAWRERDGLFLIEFRARAARPRTNLRYRVSVPVDWSDPADDAPRIRFVARGFGVFEVSDPVLTNGVVRIGPRPGTPRKASMGVPAGAGFPDFDWQADRGSWEPRFGGARLS